MRAIHFMSALAAGKVIPDTSSAMISVTEPGESSPVSNQGWGYYLHSAFADVSYDENTYQVLGPDVFREVYSDAITSAQARQISMFIRSVLLDPTIDKLYVHCHRGRSRSAAIALYASELAGTRIDGDTREHNHLVLAMVRTPNRYSHLWRVPGVDTSSRKIGAVKKDGALHFAQVSRKTGWI